ncbi:MULTISPECIES: hypothetical protein [Cellulophaga]|uniref:Uncharacterized protein n=2 Tax=Cellulophaga TaxID=104264 RepID=F0RAY0_CELLC|nr:MULTISPECIES: hypothetical protein [Cellulophaga]ADY30557.1 hypothetical protein Celly_2740 [Cellulophaga lytica DSM 7489]AIM61545.1 hypothetical protein IX49_13795 [Cellulophaga lytica]APU11437.1 hypothetical protein A5M85_14455 [Cellulophaga lytica]EWH14888.1 hypothetical protein KLA_03632 [Cellulophaga geojensis KL-A]MDO6853193.1 hypothetical protein [Cellulophaga lytica]
MIFGITLIILGILAAPSLLLSRKPDAQELLDKITPYQGWIGLAFCVWGVWGIISSILNLGWLTTYPIYWATFLAVNVLLAALGFILGYGMINKHLLSKNEEAKAKGELLLAKLRPLQGKLGIAAIALGVWQIITKLLFFV